MRCRIRNIIFFVPAEPPEELLETDFRTINFILSPRYCGYNLLNHHHALADAEACAEIALKIPLIIRWKAKRIQRNSIKKEVLI